MQTLLALSMQDAVIIETLHQIEIEEMVFNIRAETIEEDINVVAETEVIHTTDHVHTSPIDVVTKLVRTQKKH